MKSRTYLASLALVALVAAPLACATSGGDGGSSGCVALVTCCATLSSAEAEACSAVANDPVVTASECAEELGMMKSAGACGGTTTGDDAAVNSSTTGCAALTACCATLPVSEEPTECTAVATGGTSTACSESLAQYQMGGYCTGSATPETFCTSTVGSSVLCDIHVTINLGYCEEGGQVSACPTEGLAGCCVLDSEAAEDEGWDAECSYDEGAEGGQGEASCNELNGTWVTSISAATSLLSTPVQS